MILKNNLFKAKYETFEFFTGDLLLVSGGILIGTNYIDSAISTPLGIILVGIGFFLGLRVLWKFSSDLRSTKTLVDNATNELRKTNENVKLNEKTLIDANKELQKTKNDIIRTKQELDAVHIELQKSTKKFQEASEKIFGHSMTFSRSSSFNPLDRIVDELKRDVEKIKQERAREKRGW